MIRDNLKLSFEERIAQHQNTIDFVDELKQIRKGHLWKLPPEASLEKYLSLTAKKNQVFFTRFPSAGA